MKILLINPKGDPRKLAHDIGQLPSGHFATVEAVVPIDSAIEAMLAKKTFQFIVIGNFDDEFEQVETARRLAKKYPASQVTLVHGERVAGGPPNLLVFQDVSAFIMHIMQDEA